MGVSIYAIMDARIPPISNLPNLLSFVTNSPSVLLMDSQAALPKVSVLAEILDSGAEFEHVAIVNYVHNPRDLPAGPETSIGRSIAQCNRLQTLYLSARSEHSTEPALSRVLISALSPCLECVEARNIALSDCVGELNVGLKSCTALASLSFIGCFAGDDEFAAGIGKVKSLESLDISQTLICGSQLGSALSRLRNLTSLRLSNDWISPAILRTFASLRWSKISELDLSHGWLLDEGVDVLAGLVGKAPLRTLNLADNNITPVGGARLDELIRGARCLRSLDISYNNLQKSIHYTKTISALSELNVRYCRMGIDGIVSMFGVSRCKNALTSLQLDGNGMHDIGIKAVSSYLLACGQQTLPLQTLSVAGNTITPEGATELAHVLAHSPSLDTFDIGKNGGIGPEGTCTLIAALCCPERSCRLHKLNMRGCRIGNIGAFVMEAFISSASCRCIDVSDNEIGSEGLKAISDGVATARDTIEVLNIGENDMDLVGARAVAEKIIIANGNLCALNIITESLKPEVADVIVQAVGRRNIPGALMELAVSKASFGEDRISALQAQKDHEPLRLYFDNIAWFLH